MPASTEPIMTAVITGSHPFEVVEFIQLFRSLPGIDFYPQYLENWADDMSHVRTKYEVVLFYNMHPGPPNDAVRDALAALGDAEQGIFFFHHGMLAFWEWPSWAEVVGVHHTGKFGYSTGETVPVQIADLQHPVTQGMSAWSMTDEVYELEDAAPGSHVLLTTDHPKSMRTLAWTRQHKKSRVFVSALGHDKLAYADPSFQKLVLRGIQWAAGRI